MRRPQECKWDALRTTTSERHDVFGDGAYDGSDQRGIIRLPSQIFRTFLHVCHKISFMFSGVSRTPKSSGISTEGRYDHKICRVRDLSCGDTRIFLELEVRRLDCRNCGRVKRERLDFLADNPHYTKRFAYYVGRRCRSATIKDVAADLRLDWHTVKTLDQQYMQAQLARAGRPWSAGDRH